MNNVIVHHGIPGMKWGKRNGPPYPLDPRKDYSAAEKEGAKRRGVLGAYDSGKKLAGDIKEAKRQKKIKNRTIDPRDMTDEELNEQIKRLKLEENYLTLIGKETPAQLLKRQQQLQGESLTKQVLGDIGKSVIVPLGSAVVEYKIRQHYKKKAAVEGSGNVDSLNSIKKAVGDDSQFAEVLKTLSGADYFKDMNKAAKKQEAYNKIKEAVGGDEDKFSKIKNILDNQSQTDKGWSEDDLNTFLKHLASKWNKK